MGLDDMAIIRIPQTEVNNSRVIERGSNYMTYHKGRVKQNAMLTLTI